MSGYFSKLFCTLLRWLGVSLPCLLRLFVSLPLLLSLFDSPLCLSRCPNQSHFSSYPPSCLSCLSLSRSCLLHSLSFFHLHTAGIFSVLLSLSLFSPSLSFNHLYNDTHTFPDAHSLQTYHDGVCLSGGAFDLRCCFWRRSRSSIGSIFHIVLHVVELGVVVPAGVFRVL